MSEDLKPCPFCGGRGRITKDADPDFTGYFIAVKCNDCGATSRQKYFSNGNDCPLTYQECRDEWNTRAAQSVGVKPLEWDKGIVDWARPLPGMKYVACSSEGRTWAWWLEGDGRTHAAPRQVHENESAAKSAAQADYERRILSALQPVPVTVQQEWQPIETAPKGKTEPIDIWVIHEGVGLRITNVRHWDLYDGATHWMPRTQAPGQ